MTYLLHGPDPGKLIQHDRVTVPLLFIEIHAPENVRINCCHRLFLHRLIAVIECGLMTCLKLVGVSVCRPDYPA
jgi:hypothetical protein